MADALIVAVLAAAGIAYLYLRQRERERRLELVHAERLAAMDKGIPLPEIPIDPPRVPKPQDPKDILIHGVVWTAFGVGGMLMLALMAPASRFWPAPLPLAFLGVGFILYYFLARERPR